MDYKFKIDIFCRNVKLFVFNIIFNWLGCLWEISDSQLNFGGIKRFNDCGVKKG